MPDASLHADRSKLRNAIPSKKTGRFVGLLLLGLAHAAFAADGFKVPGTVFRMDELVQAQARAREKEKPIAFLYSDEHTGCGLCVRASVQMIDELKMKCVLVYVDARQNFTGYPQTVAQALRAPEGGQTIPKTVVMDANLENVLLFIPYARGPALDEALKQAKKTLATAAPARPSSRRLRPPTP